MATMLVTRNVADRVRGFLASCMVEISPGVYVSPRMANPVRERIWQVLVKWNVGQQEDSAVLVWTDRTLPAQMGVRTLGTTRKELVTVDGVLLARKPLTDDELRSLTSEIEPLGF